MADNENNQNHLTSLQFTGIKLKDPAEYAAGGTAIKVALDHAIKEMGPARAFTILAKLNQKDGFDCPGCAWPDPDDKRSVLGEYCENGAKAIAEEATLKRVKPEFFTTYSVDEMATWSDYEIGKSGRITNPMILKQGATNYESISWEKAFIEIASQLNRLDDPDEAIFYTSGRSSNEAAFLYGLFVRAFGTNNMPDCSNMCHESSGVALKETLGIGKGSVVLDDFNKAEVVLVIGQNPGTNHPRMLSALQKCKQNGGKVITINPIEEAGLKKFKNPQKIGDFFTGGTAITDVYLQVKINEDIALLKCIMLKLHELETKKGNIFDQDFIQDQTSGYETFIEDLQKHKINDLVKQSGVLENKIDKAIKILAPAKKIIICWAMGLTQHKNGVENIKECVNLLLLKGSIGKEGAGTCPVRGHSNVQGDRTMGIVTKSSDALKKAFKHSFNLVVPERKGLDTVHAIQAMHNGKAKVFIALGGNFLSAASDTNYTAKALRNCALTVSISTKLNRTHMVAGHTSIILPTLGRSEIDLSNGKPRYITVENSMGKVHKSKGSLAPASEFLMSEPEIIANIASATLGNDTNIDWIKLGTDYEFTRKKIAEVIQGFEDFDQKVNEDSGFYLPNNARVADFSKLPQGSAQFSINSVSKHHLEADEYILMTIRSHDQFNTTIYGLNDRYRGVFNERRVLFMNEKDMTKSGFNRLDVVDLVSNYDGEERIAPKFLVVPYQIPPQNLACYFPEANTLVPINHFAEKSNTPISKSIKIKVKLHNS